MRTSGTSAALRTSWESSGRLASESKTTRAGCSPTPSTRAVSSGSSCDRRVDAHGHGVALRAPAVGPGAARLAGDPLRVTAARRDLAVEGHRRLEDHERPPGPGMLAERLVQEARRVTEVVVDQLHLDPLVAQDAEPASGRLCRRIVGRHHDSRDPRADDRLRAGRGAALVTARFERHVEGCARRILAAGRERDTLGVRLAGACVEALSDHLAALDDDGADERIGAGVATSGRGQLDSSLQVARIALCDRRRSHLGGSAECIDSRVNDTNAHHAATRSAA